jgi:hypothetical protein
VITFARHPLHDIVVAPEKVAVAGTGRDPRGIHPTEELKRIVSRAMPEGDIDGCEETASLTAPAPPQVHGDRCQSLDPGGQVGDAALLNNHGQL